MKEFVLKLYINGILAVPKNMSEFVLEKFNSFHARFHDVIHLKTFVSQYS